MSRKISAKTWKKIRKIATYTVLPGIVVASLSASTVAYASKQAYNAFYNKWSNTLGNLTNKASLYEQLLSDAENGNKTAWSELTSLLKLNNISVTSNINYSLLANLLASNTSLNGAAMQVANFEYANPNTVYHFNISLNTINTNAYNQLPTFAQKIILPLNLINSSNYVVCLVPCAIFNNLWNTNGNNFSKSNVILTLNVEGFEVPCYVTTLSVTSIQKVQYNYYSTANNYDPKTMDQLSLYDTVQVANVSNTFYLTGQNEDSNNSFAETNSNTSYGWTTNTPTILLNPNTSNNTYLYQLSDNAVVNSLASGMLGLYDALGWNTSNSNMNLGGDILQNFWNHYNSSDYNNHASVTSESEYFNAPYINPSENSGWSYDNGIYHVSSSSQETVGADSSSGDANGMIGGITTTWSSGINPAYAYGQDLNSKGIVNSSAFDGDVFGDVQQLLDNISSTSEGLGVARSIAAISSIWAGLQSAQGALALTPPFGQIIAAGIFSATQLLAGAITAGESGLPHVQYTFHGFGGYTSSDEWLNDGIPFSYAQAVNSMIQVLETSIDIFLSNSSSASSPLGYLYGGYTSNISSIDWSTGSTYAKNIANIIPESTNFLSNASVSTNSTPTLEDNIINALASLGSNSMGGGFVYTAPQVTSCLDVWNLNFLQTDGSYTSYQIGQTSANVSSANSSFLTSYNLSENNANTYIGEEAWTSQELNEVDLSNYTLNTTPIIPTDWTEVTSSNSTLITPIKYNQLVSNEIANTTTNTSSSTVSSQEDQFFSGPKPNSATSSKKTENTISVGLYNTSTSYNDLDLQTITSAYSHQCNELWQTLTKSTSSSSDGLTALTGWCTNNTNNSSTTITIPVSPSDSSGWSTPLGQWIVNVAKANKYTVLSPNRQNYTITVSNLVLAINDVISLFNDSTFNINNYLDNSNSSSSSSSGTAGANGSGTAGANGSGTAGANGSGTAGANGSGTAGDGTTGDGSGVSGTTSSNNISYLQKYFTNLYNFANNSANNINPTTVTLLQELSNAYTTYENDLSNQSETSADINSLIKKNIFQLLTTQKLGAIMTVASKDTNFSETSGIFSMSSDTNNQFNTSFSSLINLLFFAKSGNDYTQSLSSAGTISTYNFSSNASTTPSSNNDWNTNTTYQLTNDASNINNLLSYLDTSLSFNSSSSLGKIIGSNSDTTYTLKQAYAKATNANPLSATVTITPITMANTTQNLNDLINGQVATTTSNHVSVGFNLSKTVTYTITSNSIPVSYSDYGLPVVAANSNGYIMGGQNDSNVALSKTGIWTINGNSPLLDMNTATLSATSWDKDNVSIPNISSNATSNFNTLASVYNYGLYTGWKTNNDVITQLTSSNIVPANTSYTPLSFMVDQSISSSATTLVLSNFPVYFALGSNAPIILDRSNNKGVFSPKLQTAIGSTLFNNLSATISKLDDTNGFNPIYAQEIDYNAYSGSLSATSSISSSNSSSYSNYLQAYSYVTDYTIGNGNYFVNSNNTASYTDLSSKNLSSSIFTPSSVSSSGWILNYGANTSKNIDTINNVLSTNVGTVTPYTASVSVSGSIDLSNFISDIKPTLNLTDLSANVNQESQSSPTTYVSYWLSNNSINWLDAGNAWNEKVVTSSNFYNTYYQYNNSDLGSADTPINVTTLQSSTQPVSKDAELAASPDAPSSSTNYWANNFAYLNGFKGNASNLLSENNNEFSLSSLTISGESYFNNMGTFDNSHLYTDYLSALSQYATDLITNGDLYSYVGNDNTNYSYWVSDTASKIINPSILGGDHTSLTSYQYNSNDGFATFVFNSNMNSTVTLPSNSVTNKNITPLVYISPQVSLASIDDGGNNSYLTSLYNVSLTKNNITISVNKTDNLLKKDPSYTLTSLNYPYPISASITPYSSWIDNSTNYRDLISEAIINFLYNNRIYVSTITTPSSDASTPSNSLFQDVSVLTSNFIQLSITNSNNNPFNTNAVVSNNVGICTQSNDVGWLKALSTYKNISGDAPLYTLLNASLYLKNLLQNKTLSATTLSTLNSEKINVQFSFTSGLYNSEINFQDLNTSYSYALTTVNGDYDTNGSMPTPDTPTPNASSSDKTITQNEGEAFIPNYTESESSVSILHQGLASLNYLSNSISSTWGVYSYDYTYGDNQTESWTDLDPNTLVNDSSMANISTNTTEYNVISVPITTPVAIPVSNMLDFNNSSTPTTPNTPNTHNSTSIIPTSDELSAINQKLTTTYINYLALSQNYLPLYSKSLNSDLSLKFNDLLFSDFTPTNLLNNTQNEFSTEVINLQNSILTKDNDTKLPTSNDFVDLNYGNLMSSLYLYSTTLNSEFASLITGTLPKDAPDIFSIVKQYPLLSNYLVQLIAINDVGAVANAIYKANSQSTNKFTWLLTYAIMNYYNDVNITNAAIYDLTNTPQSKTTQNGVSAIKSSATKSSTSKSQTTNLLSGLFFSFNTNSTSATGELATTNVSLTPLYTPSSYNLNQAYADFIDSLNYISKDDSSLLFQIFPNMTNSLASKLTTTNMYSFANSYNNNENDDDYLNYTVSDYLFDYSSNSTTLSLSQLFFNQAGNLSFASLNVKKPAPTAYLVDPNQTTSYTKNWLLSQIIPHLYSYTANNYSELLSESSLFAADLFTLISDITNNTYTNGLSPALIANLQQILTDLSIFTQDNSVLGFFELNNEPFLSGDINFLTTTTIKLANTTPVLILNPIYTASKALVATSNNTNNLSTYYSSINTQGETGNGSNTFNYNGSNNSIAGYYGQSVTISNNMQTLAQNQFGSSQSKNYINEKSSTIPSDLTETFTFTTNSISNLSLNIDNSTYGEETYTLNSDLFSTLNVTNASNWYDVWQNVIANDKLYSDLIQASLYQINLTSSNISIPVLDALLSMGNAMSLSNLISDTGSSSSLLQDVNTDLLDNESNNNYNNILNSAIYTIYNVILLYATINKQALDSTNNAKQFANASAISSFNPLNNWTELSGVVINSQEYLQYETGDSNDNNMYGAFTLVQPSFTNSNNQSEQYNVGNYFALASDFYSNMSPYLDYFTIDLNTLNQLQTNEYLTTPYVTNVETVNGIKTPLNYTFLNTLNLSGSELNTANQTDLANMTTFANQNYNFTSLIQVVNILNTINIGDNAATYSDYALNAINSQNGHWTTFNIFNNYPTVNTDLNIIATSVLMSSNNISANDVSFIQNYSNINITSFAWPSYFVDYPSMTSISATFGFSSLANTYSSYSSLSQILATMIVNYNPTSQPLLFNLNNANGDEITINNYYVNSSLLTSNNTQKTWSEIDNKSLNLVNSVAYSVSYDAGQYNLTANSNNSANSPFALNFVYGSNNELAIYLIINNPTTLWNADIYSIGPSGNRLNDVLVYYNSSFVNEINEYLSNISGFSYSVVSDNYQNAYSGLGVYSYNAFTTPTPKLRIASLISSNDTIVPNNTAGVISNIQKIMSEYSNDLNVSAISDRNGYYVVSFKANSLIADEVANLYDYLIANNNSSSIDIANAFFNANSINPYQYVYRTNTTLDNVLLNNNEWTILPDNNGYVIVWNLSNATNNQINNNHGVISLDKSNNLKYLSLLSLIVLFAIVGIAWWLIRRRKTKQMLDTSATSDDLHNIMENETNNSVESVTDASDTQDFD